MRHLILLVQLLMALSLSAQTYQQGYRQSLINPDLLSYYWPAFWICTPASNGQYEVSHFRKTFSLDQVPRRFVIHVSADNRYKLFVNGQLVSLGPARCDVYNWNFETVDIAKYLHQGKNALAAVVWNYADQRPAAQVSYGKTELIVQGDTEAEGMVNTDGSWLCMVDRAYSPCMNGDPVGYYVAGPGEVIDGSQYPWGWEQTDYDDSQWVTANFGSHGAAKGTRDYTGRLLVPTPIPPMEMRQVRFAGNTSLKVPAHTKKRWLLDNRELATGYLNIQYSRGRGASITIGYAESLYEHRKESKGNRNETVGKDFHGYRDSIIADGGANRNFTSLWWRTWRYVEVVVETQDEPLLIDDIFGTTSLYPFVRESKFSAAGRQDLQDILDIGWRTARLCANETYMDCPYYEQMQYFGDTRIQAMITLYNTRDTCMVKRALELGRQSISPDGITMSRYPTASPQFIPPYALSWIGIAYDYWMMRGDEEYVRTLLSATRSIIAWYEQWLMEDGSLGKTPYWNFADWAQEFVQGEPRKDKTGHSAFQDFELLKALQEIAAVEEALGIPAIAAHYRDVASKIVNTAKEKYWVDGKGMFADTKDHDTFSQHVNILAILTGLINGEDARRLFQTIIQDSTLAQCTVYYRYYLNQAMAKAGLGDELLNSLEIWERQMQLGLTTWAESPEPSRSDCHAWGASPNVEFFRTIIGIRSIAPGFRQIEIAPSLGSLSVASGSVPHPDGDISVNYQRKNNRLTAIITIPDGTTGQFIWQGKSYELISGTQTIQAK